MSYNFFILELVIQFTHKSLDTFMIHYAVLGVMRYKSNALRNIITFVLTK